MIDASLLDVFLKKPIDILYVDVIEILALFICSIKVIFHLIDVKCCVVLNFVLSRMYGIFLSDKHGIFGRKYIPLSFSSIAFSLVVSAGSSVLIVFSFGHAPGSWSSSGLWCSSEIKINKPILYQYCLRHVNKSKVHICTNTMYYKSSSFVYFGKCSKETDFGI